MGVFLNGGTARFRGGGLWVVGGMAYFRGYVFMLAILLEGKIR